MLPPTQMAVNERMDDWVAGCGPVARLRAEPFENIPAPPVFDNAESALGAAGRYFPNPWLDDDEKPTEFQPERLKGFEDFRDRYVGENDIEFVRRPG